MDNNMENSKILEIKKERLVARELNFDFGCFFYPNEKKKYTETRTFILKKKDADGNIRKLKASLEPAQHSVRGQLGILTTLDERIFYILVELWIKQNKESLIFFSLREIAVMLNIQWGKYTNTAIYNSLLRLRMCFIFWEESFFLKEENNYIKIEEPFTILNKLSIFSNRKEGIGSPISSCSFDEKVLSNFINNYSRPISLSNVLNFKSPLTQTVYTLLERKLYGTNDFSIFTKKLILDEIQLIGKSYHQKKHRVQKLKKIISELIGLKLPFGETITEVFIEKGENGDAIFRVKRTGAKQIKAKVLKAQDFTKKYSKDISSEIRKVLVKFEECFGSRFSIQKTPDSVIEYSKHCIDEYGLNAVLFSIGHIKEHYIKKSYQPDTLNGLRQYVPKAVRDYKQHLQTKNRQKENAKKDKQIAQEVKQQTDVNDCMDDYNNHVLKILDNIQNKKPMAYNAFAYYEEQQRIKATSNLKGNKKLIETAELHFNRPRSRVARLEKFFAESNEIAIPTFKEWRTNKGE